jgi:hypothetical protein
LDFFRYKIFYNFVIKTLDPDPDWGTGSGSALKPVRIHLQHWYLLSEKGSNLIEKSVELLAAILEAGVGRHCTVPSI